MSAEVADHSADEIFPAGTFTPQPEVATLPAMLRAQIAMEASLILRHGEQLLLTLFIPIALLVGLSVIDIGFIDDDPSRISHVAPMLLAVAAMSTGFTGQAIAVAFDRRYGAVKRLGSTALPRWCLIAGKIGAVVLVSVLQFIVLAAIAFCLGWSPGMAGLAGVFVLFLLGALAFTALGLMIGGALKAEVVLALANLVWFIFLGCAGVVISQADGAAVAWAEYTPSGALVAAINCASHGSFAVLPVLVVAVWGALGVFGAVRWFKFTG